MRALFLDQQASLRRNHPEPVPTSGEALVRVRCAGICGTDLAMLHGYAPFRGVLGHEFVGEIAAAPGAPHRVGQRVVGEINIGCGSCAACAAGRPTHCAVRQVAGIRGRDGAFAEFLCLPLANLHPVPDRVPDDAAVFTEPLAAAARIAEQVQVAPTTRVLVVGAGRLGQLIARVLALCACELVVVARHPRQRALLEMVGLGWIGEHSVPQRAFDLVVEATGAPGGFALARSAVRPRGCLVLKSTYGQPVETDLAGLVVDEIQLLGSRCGPFPPALRLLELGLVDPTPLIDARFPLAMAQRALARAQEPGSMKVLLDCTR